MLRSGTHTITSTLLSREAEVPRAHARCQGCAWKQEKSVPNACTTGPASASREQESSCRIGRDQRYVLFNQTETYIPKRLFAIMRSDCLRECGCFTADGFQLVWKMTLACCLRLSP